MEQTTPDTLDHTPKTPVSSFNIASSPFWLGLAGCAVLITFLFGINLATSPGYLWAIWPAMGISFSFLMAHIGRQLAKHYKL